MDRLLRRHGGGHDDDSSSSSSTAGIGLLTNTKTGDPWAGQAKYAKGVVAIGCIVVALAAILAIPSRLRHRRLDRARTGGAPRRSHGAAGTAVGRRHPVEPPRRAASFCRFLAYRQLPSYRLGFVDLRFPALGVTLLLCALMLGVTAWMFAVQPYYRSAYTFGSPPLALRAGMMALGLMPFIYALGSKVNLISALTGTSHERLQVYHQWIARFMLFLATVHTIPFIRQPLQEGGTAALREWFFSDHINTTGTVAYACLFVLVFGSFAGLRERCYELFVAVHIPVAVTFLAFMFIHTSQLLTSWRYLWGTAALYMLSVFLRLARQLSSHSLFGLCRCRVEALDGRLTRLTIRTPLTWRPGQHVFVRFPAIEPWSAHPFTIVSMPRPDHSGDSAIVLMAKAHGGFTRKLHSRALAGQAGEAETSTETTTAMRHGEHIDDHDADEQLLRPSSSTSLSAIVDGPYGQDAGVSDFDAALFIAGGSGITLAMASLLDLAWQWRNGTAQTRRARLVWSVRNDESVEWMREHIETVEALAPRGSFGVVVHISQSAGGAASTLPASWQVHRDGHPDVSLAIDAFLLEEVPSSSSSSSMPSADVEKGETPLSETSSASTSPDAKRSSSPASSVSAPTPSSSVAVVVCGPEGMSRDAGNRVAKLQLDMARGRLKHLEQVYLVNERFGW
ncbi:uncharacterized protein PFL1_04855 [Pseudozyma flocculosa PF-1]|uniref:ferric-chelate reductase (NADPH) n=2 Tax=Pseudozyma flocculosa TaxID=84751 RepID=A0A5C3F494_9BASI|nr:uncharacterized protein PFL1_04855 [Pseudozyma flocculosa PF-1]EPQ27717.1 hypothetical protein PFL1_04855 [Pseudozyma flocculosa PF-1]SPO39142.1 related to ferric reductase [Pseudozyma flocculosa]